MVVHTYVPPATSWVRVKYRLCRETVDLCCGDNGAVGVGGGGNGAVGVAGGSAVGGDVGRGGAIVGGNGVAVGVKVGGSGVSMGLLVAVADGSIVAVDVAVALSVGRLVDDAVGDGV